MKELNSHEMKEVGGGWNPFEVVGRALGEFVHEWICADLQAALDCNGYNPYQT